MYKKFRRQKIKIRCRSILYGRECKTIHRKCQEKIPVEFVSKKINDDDLRKIYRKLYVLSENARACPALAYVLFYPDLVESKVGYFIAGNEPAQMLGLFYNRMAPKIAYKFVSNKFLNFLINLGRIITFRAPFKSGQFQTLMTMKQLAYGESFPDIEYSDFHMHSPS
ncbi:MAG: hypothetical protein GX482_00970 [Acholeplasmataceae bacterium]|nr:hypothetical protein [Acholeplasmataceae bacterium]